MVVKLKFPPTLSVVGGTVTDNLNAIDEESDDPLRRLESLIRSGEFAKGRVILRRWLFAALGDHFSGESIADGLAELSKRKPDREKAIVILRCLAEESFLPQPSEANQIIRSLVALSESAVPELVAYARVVPRSQNYEKYQALSGLHESVLSLLKPVTQQFGDIEALCNGWKSVIGALNHSIVRAYGEPFRLNEVRTAIEACFSRLRRIASPESTFLKDYEECVRSISDGRSTAKEIGSFLAFDVLEPFFVNTEQMLEAYLQSVRARYQTSISRGGGERTDLQKRYPLHEEGRQFQIIIPLRNSGPGLATDVKVTTVIETEELFISNLTASLGNVRPGEFSVVLDAMVITPMDKFSGLIEVEWGELGTEGRRTETMQFRALAQAAGIDWQKLAYWTPYSTDVAEGENFIGRVEKVERIASKLLRTPMEPFYVTGQKRVGKTSLALAAADFAARSVSSGALKCHYILWGDVAHAQPEKCLMQLGESIQGFIRDALPKHARTEPVHFDQSLAPLINLSDLALTVMPDQKFVIIIDEFDEMPQELFLQGNLAETFFGNLRALSRRKNICLAMIGGENMPFVMERQGQKLNNFSQVNLSYFSRDEEWVDFQQMVKAPSAEILNWHDDAIAEVFNTTNGNPYYTKIVCAGVVKRAISERDADITAAEVKAAVDFEISALGTNSFLHLWQDGIPRPAEEREPDKLRRSRLLVAAARCLRRLLPLTIENLRDQRSSAALSEAEIPAVLQDFWRRDIMRESGGVYDLVLPIFTRWLADVGANRIVADSLSEELAQTVIQQENAAVVRSDEVVALSKEWPTYRGRQIGTDDIKAWYQQVPNPRDQRILFKLLKRTKVYSEAHVRERLRGAHDMLRPSLPVHITRKRNERRTDIIVTYVDGEAKSGAYHSGVYAEENSIASNRVISPGDFATRYDKLRLDDEAVSAVVIIDDIAATGKSLTDNVSAFLTEHRARLVGVKVRVVCLLATERAQNVILRRLNSFDDLDADFRACEIVPSHLFAFPEDQTGWDSSEELDRARALCTNLGARIYKQSPLGFGGLGLLVVFPTTAPNNSLPILHSHSKIGNGEPWVPLFPRIVN